MIFSRFFSPSHSSNDPDTRLKAIAKLSPESPNERRILHELAFNDSASNVSLAALEKLNSFALWLKMSQIAKDSKLVNAAQAKVECALIDGSADISTAEIKEYLLKTAPTEQVIKCLPLMTELHQDNTFCLALLAKLGRSSFTQQLLAATPDQALKIAIIEQAQDTDLLQRLLRKTSDDALAAKINQRIAWLTEQAEKPVRLAREVTLVLSKLLALLDKSDYLQISQGQGALKNEYQALQTSFDCLDEETKGSFESKYHNINERIDGLLSRLKPAYDAQQLAREHEAARHTSSKAVAEVKRLHKQLQGEQLLSLTLGEVTLFQQAVEAAEAALAQLQQFEAPAEQIETMLESYRHMWDRLPELQRQVAEAQAQLQIWQQWLDDDSAQWQLDAIKSDWQTLTVSMAVVPEFLQSHWQQVLGEFKVVNQQRQSSQQRHLKHCRKHINIINNLVEQGKYRAAMARFQRLEADYKALPADTQSLLEKRFEQTAEQIARLEGWQIYLAAPRKPELIEQAELLLSEKQEDMPARARSIKYLRQQWQSLGETQTAEDEVLNARFNELLEQAFEPCRRYYAELEKQNDLAAVERQQLIERMSALANDESDINERYQTFENLKKQWQQAGQTDAERYRQLRETWDAACGALADVITPWLQQNRQAKQALVDQVAELAESDDINLAREQAKQLQGQWKLIGPAGKRFESKLWFAFKAANDTIFSKVKSAQAQQKAEQSAITQNWRGKLAQVSLALEDSADLDAIRQQLDDCVIALKDLSDNRVQKILQKELSAVQARLDQRTAKQVKDTINNEVAQMTSQLFGGGQSVAELAAQYENLPSSWFKGQPVSSSDDWYKNLVTLEVLAQLESPGADASLRSTIQLQLMQAKLSGADLPSIDALISELLASTTVINNDDLSALKPRVVAVCMSYAQQGE